MNSLFIRKASYVTAHLTVLVVSGVLIGGFIVQFGMHEYPCPLCILERMAMILAVLGPARMIAIGHRRKRIEPQLFTTAFGMTVLASVLGGAIALRHVLIHIAPGDPGYGTPIWGLHLYTWAGLVFVALLIDAGLHLCFVREDLPIVPTHPSILSKLVLWLFGLVILANAISVFFEAGFHLFLPDNPVSYRLLE